MLLSGILPGTEDKSVNTSVTAGNALQVSHAVRFPLLEKRETVSQLVRACRIEEPWPSVVQAELQCHVLPDT